MKKAFIVWGIAWMLVAAGIVFYFIFPSIREIMRTGVLIGLIIMGIIVMIVGTYIVASTFAEEEE